MTWVGMWTIRGVVVFVGVFCVMLALDLLGLNKADNPFTSWGGFVQCLALTFGLLFLMGIELLIEHEGWRITKPVIRLGEENGTDP